jgi:cyanophycin synthetase
MHNVQNAMFAAAITYSMGIKLEEIRHGLRTFDTSFFQAPGRMNICDDHPFKVILDYGHNPAAIGAMVQLVERLDVKGKRLIVLAAPGDRRNEDIVEMARLCAGKFQRYVVRRDDGLRGRGPDEVPKMLRDTLLQHGVESREIDMIPEEVAALDHALKLCRPGDLLLAFGDNIQRCWKQITGFQPEFEKPAPTAPALAPLSFETPEVGALALGAFSSGMDGLVRDERGVRLARETED